MGFLDVVLGRRKLEKPKSERLFAMTTAYVTMETALGITSRKSAAIVFQPIENADFQQLLADSEAVVRGVGEESGTTIDTENDTYGYRWLIVRDDDFEDLVVALNALSTSLDEGGYGERILASVFAFQDDQGRPLYWIYNYKRGHFHPFVPDAARGAEARDNERELRLRAQIGTELPVEPELERWTALYGIPI
jgi:PspA associated protein B